ncbi:MAG: hypothetical protein GXP05_16815 [Alphaproteobacteria bacterium]|nr:hypothetical protein [Alphaproteobacteria bacterium]
MKLGTKTAMALAIILGGVTVTAAYAATTVNKTYLRKGTQEIRVFTDAGKLYCRRTSDDFELCHGMEEQADGSWQGDSMKHPDMPKFMTFNGTVIIGTNRKMSIKGCAVGNTLCDQEIWDEQ